MILKKSFYNRPTLKVAQDLLGCFLIRKTPPFNKGGLGGISKYKIIETEAYIGPNDLASHASRGRTERNNVMFGEPGIIYVYFTYGMHYMLNIVTERKDYPAAVLIRAVEPMKINYQLSIKNYQLNGPAKLTKSLKIDKTFNHLPIYTKKHLPCRQAGGLYIEGRDKEIKPNQIVKTTRVGIDYAKEYKDKKWRFYIKGNKFISKK